MAGATEMGRRVQRRELALWSGNSALAQLQRPQHVVSTKGQTLRRSLATIIASFRAITEPNRLTQPLCARSTMLGLALALLAQLWGANVWAADPREEEFRRHPSAALASELAAKAFDSHQLAKGMNWLERAVRSPGAGAKQSADLTKKRNDLKWDLADAGIGMLQISVQPGHAQVMVDGKELLPRAASQAVWLNEGGHLVDADAAPDYSHVSQVVPVRRGERVDVSLRCPLIRPPTLTLEVQPQAEVWIDNTYQGSSDKRRFTVSAGAHLVTVKRNTFYPWVREVPLAIGQDLTIVVQLEPINTQNIRSRQASQVDRELLPSEVDEKGDSRNLAGRPNVDSPLEKGQKRTNVQVEHGNADTKSGGRKIERVADANPSAMDRDDSPQPIVPTSVSTSSSASSSSGPATPWSNRTKGWLWTGTGIALAGAGVALSLRGISAAYTANADLTTLGSSDYQSTWDAAAQQTRLGYIGLGAGAVATAVGTAYLFSNGGLSRAGKGGWLSTVGVCAGGVAGWMLYNARALAQTANDGSLPGRLADGQYAAAQTQAKIAYGAAGVSGALVLGGVWLIATSSGSRSAQAEPTSGQDTQSESAVAAQWHIVPWTTGSGSGAVLQHAW